MQVMIDSSLPWIGFLQLLNHGIKGLKKDAFLIVLFQTDEWCSTTMIDKKDLRIYSSMKKTLKMSPLPRSTTRKFSEVEIDNPIPTRNFDLFGTQIFSGSEHNTFRAAAIRMNLTPWVSVRLVFKESEKLAKFLVKFSMLLLSKMTSTLTSSTGVQLTNLQ